MFDLNFVFVGPQRTGTTWIYNHLVEHPTLCFPKGVKETMFFDRNFKKGISWYNWHYKNCKSNQIYGEIAPSYFDHPETPKRIKDYFPKCKIIISLRDPVDRAQSLYQHHYQKGRVRGSFTEAIKSRPDIITSGYYAEHIKRWLELFEEEQILVLSMDEIKNNPDQLLSKLCVFLEVDQRFLPNSIQKEKINSAQRPRFPFLVKFGSSLVIKLHSIRLHWVINFAKKAGLKSFFFKKGENKPILSEKERLFLKEEYATHVQYVNSKFENINL